MWDQLAAKKKLREISKMWQRLVHFNRHNMLPPLAVDKITKKKKKSPLCIRPLCAAPPFVLLGQYSKFVFASFPHRYTHHIPVRAFSCLTTPARTGAPTAHGRRNRTEQNRTKQKTTTHATSERCTPNKLFQLTYSDWVRHPHNPSALLAVFHAILG